MHKHYRKIVCAHSITSVPPVVLTVKAGFTCRCLLSRVALWLYCACYWSRDNGISYHIKKQKFNLLPILWSYVFFHPLFCSVPRNLSGWCKCLIYWLALSTLFSQHLVQPWVFAFTEGKGFFVYGWVYPLSVDINKYLGGSSILCQFSWAAILLDPPCSQGVQSYGNHKLTAALYTGPGSTEVS